MSSWPILSLVTFLPLVGALFCLVVNGPKEAVERNCRSVALVTTLATFLISLLLWVRFDPTKAGFQFEEKLAWVPALNIGYHAGIDGISLFFVLLSTLLTPICILASWESIKVRVKEYMIAFLVLETFMVGMFCALDLALFYIFFEGVLIPMFLIIGVWGGKRRVYAAFKFFLYTLLGSVLMLLAIIAVYGQVGTTDLPTVMEKLDLPFTWQCWLWLAFFASFAVKVPMWPVHTWLPDAHVEAPTAGSVLLAALLLKMGGYGLFRIIMPMLPNVSPNYITLMAVIGVVSIVYGGFLALSQKDLKKMVAYSSVSHMGYVLLGAGALSVLSVQGAMFQQFSHGLITCVLFMSAGTIQHTAGTRIISELGGLADRMPQFSVLMMAGFMASLGLPGMCGFVAEVSVLAGSYENLPVYVLITIFGGIAVTAGYHLWAMQKVMFGPILKKYLDLKDPHSYEILSMSILILLIIYFGVQPATITDIMGVAAEPLVDPFLTLAQTGVI